MVEPVLITVQIEWLAPSLQPPFVLHRRRPLMELHTNNAEMKTLCFPIAAYMTVYYLNEKNSTKVQYIQGGNDNASYYPTEHR